MPPLEPGTPRPLLTTTSAPADSVSSPLPVSDDAHDDASESVADDAVDELYEVEQIIGRRPTKFGKTKGGRWRFGGNTYDYQVLQKGGETTYEPESELRKTHNDEIEEFELKHQKSTESNFQDDPVLREKPSESTSFANFRNFVHLGFFCYLAKLLPVFNTKWKDIQVPENRAEMLRSVEKEHWLAAERRELDEISAKETWRKVKRPKKKPISCRWVYKLKPPTTLNPSPIFKARLVAHGYKQNTRKRANWHIL